MEEYQSQETIEPTAEELQSAIDKYGDLVGPDFEEISPSSQLERIAALEEFTKMREAFTQNADALQAEIDRTKIPAEEAIDALAATPEEDEIIDEKTGAVSESVSEIVS